MLLRSTVLRVTRPRAYDLLSDCDTRGPGPSGPSRQPRAARGRGLLALTSAHPPVSLYFEQFIIYYLVVVGVRPPFAVGLQDLVNERRPAGPHILQQMQRYAYGCDNQIVCLLSGSALNAQ